MDVISYALSKKIAAHVVSGIQSMSVNGQTLTINTKDSGVLTMTFPTPKDGVSVTDIDVNANNQIVFTMSDGSEFISGKIPTVKGEPGFSPTIAENADNTDKIYKLDITTADSTFTTPNLKGADGQGGGGGDSSVTLTQEEYEALTEEEKLNGLYYIYDTKRIYKNGVQYGASEPISLTMEEYKALKEAGAIDEQQEYLIEADDKGILISAEDIGYNNAKSGIQATTVQGAIDKIAESGGSGEKNVQSDWNETDDTADGFIKNKPTIPDITGLATETYVDNKVADYTKTADLADVAISGSYNDLADKPTIPDAYDDTALSNRVKTIEDDYAKSSDIPSLSGYATETWVNEQGFLTEHQDISNLVQKEDGKTLISTEDISQIAQNKTDIETLNGAGEGSIEKKIADKLSEQTYLTKEIATADEIAAYISAPTTAKFNVIYLVKDENATGADKYFEYQRIGNEESSSFQMTGDTSTNLSDYAKTADIPTTLPANGGNADTVNNHTVESDVPENAVFTDTIYDDTEVKENIAELNNNLDTLEFGEVAGGKNLFNKNSSDNVDGYLVNGIPNGETYYSQKTSHFIEINSENFVYNLGNTNNHIAFYDSNRAFINQIHQNDGINIVEIPANAKYVRVVYFDVEKDLVQIEKGTTATPYEPYIPSVKMLADKVSAQNESLSVIGKCKNLLNPYGDSTTINGITITKNKDKTYTLNGTATDVVSFEIYTLDISKNIGKTLKLVGCPRGGSYFNYLMTASDNINIDSTLNDFGNGATKKILQWGKTNWWKVYISVKKGTTVSNLVFKPMLVDAEKTPNATYDDFTPYCGDNSTLTEEVASLKNDLDKLSSLPIGSIIQIEAAKDNIETTTQKYGWQYLGTSNIECNDGSIKLLVTNVYRKNN